MVLARKTCWFKLDSHQEVTPNCLAVKLTSALKQDLELDFAYNPNYEVNNIKNLKAAIAHLAEYGCANQWIIRDYNCNMNKELDYVWYIQDPHHASRDLLFGLQEDNVFIDVFRFLHPFDLWLTKTL